MPAFNFPVLPCLNHPHTHLPIPTPCVCIACPPALQSSARDLIHLFARHFHGSGPSVVIGHSMGGKVALELVRQLAAAPPGSLAMPQQVGICA